MKELFDNCCGKNLLTSMNGKLYRCPFAANADSFKGIPLDQRNSIPINSTAEEIQRYTRELEFKRRIVPRCRWLHLRLVLCCIGRQTPDLVAAVDGG